MKDTIYIKSTRPDGTVKITGSWNFPIKPEDRDGFDEKDIGNTVINELRDGNKVEVYLDQFRG